MHIVQVASFYGPRSGGLRTAVDALGRGYREHGHERTLIVPGPRDTDEDTQSGRRIVVASPTLPGGGGYHVLVARQRLRTLIKRLDPDRLEVSDKLLAAFFGRLAQRLGVRAMLLSHERLDGILDCRLPRSVPSSRLADAWNRRFVDLYPSIVCASSWAAEELRRVGAAVDRIPLGVDLETFHPTRGDERRDREKVVVACVTRLSREKRPEVAIETIAALVDRRVPARLVLAGGGPMNEAIRRSARGLPVTFTGHLTTPAAVASVLASADVALAPCPVETFGLSALEAMACGTPVVIADGGGAPELLAPHTGQLAPPDGRSFASAVVDLFSRDRGRTRDAARRHAEGFAWSTTVAAMLEAHRLVPARVG